MKKSDFNILQITTNAILNDINLRKYSSGEISPSLFDEKRSLIKLKIGLGKKKETKFWTLYDRYEKDQYLIIKAHGVTITGYRETFNKEDSDGLDKKLAADISKWTREYFKFYSIYFKELKKIIGGKKAKRLIELEATFQIAFKIGLQEINLNKQTA